MKESNKEVVLYKKAKSKVERIKKFYRHLSVYLVINIILFGVKVSLYDQLGGQEVVDQGFQNWYGLNLFITPLLWGLGLVIHGLVAFKFLNFTKKGLTPSFIKKWEERQLQKFIEEDREQHLY